MITTYLVGISEGYEGEDIEVRYSIYEGEELVVKKSVSKEYKKPAVVTLFSLITVLKELEKYKNQEITILVNDAAIKEQIKGTSTTKNRDIHKNVNILKGKLKDFKNVIIKDISQEKLELVKWDEILRA